MELLYAQEHLSCYNYEKGGKRPTIEKLILKKGGSFGMFFLLTINLYLWSAEL